MRDFLSTETVIQIESGQGDPRLRGGTLVARGNEYVRGTTLFSRESGNLRMASLRHKPHPVVGRSL